MKQFEQSALHPHVQMTAVFYGPLTNFLQCICRPSAVLLKQVQKDLRFLEPFPIANNVSFFHRHDAPAMLGRAQSRADAIIINQS